MLSRPPAGPASALAANARACAAPATMAFIPCTPLPAGGAAPWLGACTARPRMALRGRTPEQRDAELQAQKEILERRRNEKASAEYMESVAARRADAEAFFQSNQLDIQPGEDPLEAWKRKEARGMIKPLGYEDVPEGGIPLPAASFGIPKYDNGERTCPGGSLASWQSIPYWCWGAPLSCLLNLTASRALIVAGVCWGATHRASIRLTRALCLLILFFCCRCVFSLTKLSRCMGVLYTGTLVPLRL